MRDYDHCPTCGRRIPDIDPDGLPAGCEAEDGQRWCIEHLAAATPAVCFCEGDPDTLPVRDRCVPCKARIAYGKGK